MMRVLFLVTALALSGCAGANDETDDGGYSEVLKASLAEDSIMLVGYRAIQETRVTVTESQDLSGSRRAGAQFDVGWTGYNADVRGLLAAANGEAPAPGFWFGSGGGGGGGGGGTGLLPEVRYKGTTITEGSGGSWTASGSDSSSGKLMEGEWLLIVAGLCGQDADETEGDWSFRIQADAPLEKLVLPTATMVCGAGFADFPETNLGPIHDGTISQRWPSQYGATIKTISLGPTVHPEPDGDWVLPDQTLPIEAVWDSQRSLLAGEMGFEVREHRGSNLIWSLQGLPFMV